MKTFLIILSVLLNTIVASTQTTSCIDVRYVEAIKYFQNNDSIKKEIKKHMGKESLKYRIQNSLISSNVHDFIVEEERKKMGISENEETLIDSLNKTTGSNYIDGKYVKSVLDKKVKDDIIDSLNNSYLGYSPPKVVEGLSLFSIETKADYVLAFSPITKNSLFVKFSLAPILILSDGSIRVTNSSGLYLFFIFDSENNIKNVSWSYWFLEGGTTFLSNNTGK